MVKDYYHLLGLPRFAPLNEVKAAYRKLAALYHPDKLIDQSPASVQAATARMMELNEAVDILSDPARCADYHELLDLIPERPLEEPPLRPLAPTPPPEPAPDAFSPQPPPTPPKAPPTAPESQERRTILREEQGRNLKDGLKQLPLKWKESAGGGWHWTLEAGDFRRAVYVAYRHLETLSQLSAGGVQRAVETLFQRHKNAMRPTAVFAIVSYDRLMDAQAVQSKMKESLGGKRGWLKAVHPVVVLIDAAAQRVVLLGTPLDDSEARRVLECLRRSGQS